MLRFLSCCVWLSITPLLVAQDSLRAVFIVEVAASRSDFLWSGGPESDLDRFYADGVGMRLGAMISVPFSPKISMRTGMAGGWRSFGSTNFEFRVPASGNQWDVQSYTQNTTLSYLSMPLLFEWYPHRRIGFQVGAQLIAAFSTYSRGYMPGVHAYHFDFKTGPVEGVVGMDFLPFHRLGIGLRGSYQFNKVNHTEHYYSGKTWYRDHWWYTLEAVLSVRFGRKPDTWRRGAQ